MIIIPSNVSIYIKFMGSKCFINRQFNLSFKCLTERCFLQSLNNALKNSSKSSSVTSLCECVHITFFLFKSFHWCSIVGTFLLNLIFDICYLYSSSPISSSFFSLYRLIEYTTNYEYFLSNIWFILFEKFKKSSFG
jgi:hypothetical protein